MGINTRIYIVKLVSVLVFFFLSSKYSAQQIDTLKYSFHVVEKGETSYGIAKKYNLDLNLFFDCNPEAAKGIKKGQSLKIPLITELKAPDSNSLPKDTTLKKHKVTKGETLWSIAKLYGVQVELIKNLNRIENNEISIEQELIIPDQIADTSNAVNPMIKHPSHPLLDICDTLVIHKVKKRETLYSISTKYKIPISKIIQFNPKLSELGLQKDQVLKIVYKLVNCDKEALLKKIDSIAEISQSVLEENKLNISIVLPFFINENIKSIQESKNPNLYSLNKKTVNSLSYLNGIQLALKELKKLGYNMDVNIYDSKYDTNEVKSIFMDTLFQKSHLIFGPTYSKNIKLVRTFAKTRNIPMITSFNIPNQALFGYPSLFKFYPSKATQIKFSAEYFRENKSKYNIILLANKEDKSSMTYSDIFSSTFNDTLLKFDSIKINDTLFKVDTTIIIDSIQSINLKRGDASYAIKRNLSKRDTNLFVVATPDVPFMTYIFNMLIELSNSQKYYKYKYAILGFEELYEMNTIDMEYKEKFNLHFTSRGMIDYNSDASLKFIEDYNLEYKMKPVEASFIGYDIFNSIIKKVYPVESHFNPAYNGLYNSVNFQNIDSTSGFENKHVQLFRYDNYKLQPLNDQ